MLQQKLDTSVTNSQKAAYEIQELRKALEASHNHATDIYQQAVAHVQRVEEAASQEVQRLTELGRSHDRRRAPFQGALVSEDPVIKTILERAETEKGPASRKSDNEITATRPLQRVAYDLVPMREGYNGHQWISHFVCQVTHYHWIWTHRSKGQATYIVTLMVNLAEKQYQQSITFPGQQMRIEDKHDSMASNVKSEAHLEPRRR